MSASVHSQDSGSKIPIDHKSPEDVVGEHLKNQPEDKPTGFVAMMRGLFNRSTYTGALLINILTFTLPAVYDTLAKLWIAKIDSSRVVTTDTYTYIGVVAETLNEGLPRASYLIIGDKNRTLRQRLNLCFTLIAFQMAAGLIMSLAFLGGAENFASGFVPIEVRETSITYVRIASFVCFTSATDIAVSFSTRAMDKPDVPLIISLCRTAANLIFDFMFLSNFRIKTTRPPTVNTQAAIRLACNFAGSSAGLIYFLWTANKVSAAAGIRLRSVMMPNYSTWLTMAKPGASFFTESAIRNALYLWLIHGIVALGSDYATAWGVFNTIRWGLVMVPVLALEAASSTFVGHAWNDWRARTLETQLPATWRDILGPFRLRGNQGIIRPALRSFVIALIVEVPLCLSFSFGLAYPFAKYLSGSTVVARITATMWKTIDWCYIFYAINAQLASILLATKPRWFLMNSVVVNVLWVFPWALALEVGIHITGSTAWRYHAIIFGGSLVLSFWVTLGVLALWLHKMLKGKMKI
ncbi:hypothetical protein FRC03_001194 [Tulasnella sp. 419]|nr:hypothetical protein FRC03_001194 [Tulasnella sp. 419]